MTAALRSVIAALGAAAGLSASLGVGAVVVGCCDDDSSDDEVRLEVDGTALVRFVAGGSRTVTDSIALQLGDQIEVTEGTAQLHMPDGPDFELRAAVGDARNTEVTVASVPELDAGDLLVLADQPARVASAGTSVSITDGAARVSRYLGMSVAAYEGGASVNSAGVDVEVPALRQLSVPVLGQPDTSVRPLRYDAADPWDRRFLGEAIELGEELDALSRGYTSSLNAGEGRTVGFYRLVLPGLADERRFTSTLIDVQRAPGETLVGAAITDLAAEGDFARRWREVFSFRDQGAAWGLVALDQRVDRGPLLGNVEQAIAASPFEFAGPVVTTPTTSPPTTGGTTPTTNPPTTQPPTTSTTQPPDDPDDPPDDPLDPIEDPTGPVEDVIDDLLGGLLGR